MEKTTNQIKEWSSEFGKHYTDRNPLSFEEMDALYMKDFGVTRSSLNQEFLGEMNQSICILEVGANVGTQLIGLQKMGFTHLYGIELQPYAVELSKARTQHINLIQGSAFDIPFKDGFFDLVFTSGLLIHIHPQDIGDVLDEIYRCSNQYIWGYEYFTEEYTNVQYRGKDNLLWKADFMKLYLDRFTDLKLIKEKQIPYLHGRNVDTMFLLKKDIKGKNK